METSQPTCTTRFARRYPFAFFSQISLGRTHTLRSGMVIVLFSLLLTGCAFGRDAAATEPVELDAYEPALAESAAEEPTGEVSTPEASEADEPAEEESAEENEAGDAEATETETEAEAERVASSNQPVTSLQGRVYNGNVLAQQQVDVVMEASGEVLAVNVEVGDRVQKGDVLLEVDSASLEAQKAQALASLSAAQAQVELLLLEPDESDLEAARAAVAAASEAYRTAQDGPTAEDQTIALAQLRQAEASVRRAQSAYNEVKWSPQIGALPQSEQLEQATLQLEAAQAQYEKTTQGGTADVVAGAYAQLASARAQLQALQDGVDEPQIEAARAQVRQAEAALYLAQLQLNNAVMTAPFSGIISTVNTAVGAMAAPGAPAFTLLSENVEVVIPVEETLLSKIEVGQAATIRASAYPDRVFDGEVAIIAPVVNASTRTVDITIRPVDEETGLAPGMFATVEFQD